MAIFNRRANEPIKSDRLDNTEGNDNNGGANNIQTGNGNEPRKRTEVRVIFMVRLPASEIPELEKELEDIRNKHLNMTLES